jgi:hypothetical protein
MKTKIICSLTQSKTYSSNKSLLLRKKNLKRRKIKTAVGHWLLAVGRNSYNWNVLVLNKNPFSFEGGFFCF